jgi:branched-subunit amino acid aminotransferase/4-amino-4-deoxychorismate lyase
MSATVNVNGRITDGRDAVISVFDHGFLYGEGIYETMRTYAGSRSCTTVTCGGCATRRG